jgi:hypothetical protein
MQGIVIMGFPKCGTTSLLEYLRAKYKKDIANQKGFYSHDFLNKISRREWCYLPFEEQLEKFKHEFGDPADFKIVFITRDPIDRVWSGWEAWSHYYKGYTYEEYLNMDSEEYKKKWNDRGLSYLGEVNPIKQVDYWKWIMPWMERYGSEVVNVYSLEGLIPHPSFPQTNSLKKSDIPDKYYKLTDIVLKK